MSGLKTTKAHFRPESVHLFQKYRQLLTYTVNDWQFYLSFLSCSYTLKKLCIC